MDLSELKQRLAGIEMDLDRNPVVDFAILETPTGKLSVALTDRLRKACRKGRVWKTPAMLTALKNARYGFNPQRSRSRGGADGVFLLDRNFRPVNEMMRKIFDHFLDKPDSLVAMLTARYATNVRDLIPVRVVSHNMRRHECIFELFPYIAAHAPGSYGLLYVWDDEHPVHANAFRVWRLTRGRVEELADPFLSPCIPVLEDDARDDDQTSALERETADFVANVELPGLRVWSVTRDALLEHARQHGLLHLTLDIESAAVITRSFGESRDKPTLLARAFMDLWYCSNFSAHLWDPLIETDPALATLAVEACYYVCLSSGADGSRELRELLKAHDQLDAVDSVESAAFGELAHQWANSVRGGTG